MCQIKGYDCSVVSIIGDGLCFTKAISLDIYGTEDKGEALSSLMNKHIINGLKKRSEITMQMIYPFSKRIHNGEESVLFENEEEYTRFLEEDPKAIYTWRGRLEISILATILDIRIKIITVNNGQEVKEDNYDPIPGLIVETTERNQPPPKRRTSHPDEQMPQAL